MPRRTSFHLQHGTSKTALRQAFAMEWEQAHNNRANRIKDYPQVEDVMKAFMKLDKKTIAALAVRIYQSISDSAAKSAWAIALDRVAD